MVDFVRNRQNIKHFKWKVYEILCTFIFISVHLKLAWKYVKIVIKNTFNT